MQNNTSTLTTKILSDEQIERSVSVLNRAFRDAMEEFKVRTGNTTNTKGTDLYNYQVEFSYIIDNIQRGPAFAAVSYIAEANELIARMNKHDKK